MADSPVPDLRVMAVGKFTDLFVLLERRALCRSLATPLRGYMFATAGDSFAAAFGQAAMEPEPSAEVPLRAVSLV